MAGFNDLVSASAESLLTENLRLRSGVSWNIGWTILDGSDNPVNFSGGTAIFVIKDRPGGTELVSFTQTATNGRQVILGNGSIVVDATPTGSAISPNADYFGVYELRVTKDSKTVSLASGKVTVFRGV